jgi:hypothetical protein
MPEIDPINGPDEDPLEETEEEKEKARKAAEQGSPTLKSAIKELSQSMHELSMARRAVDAQTQLTLQAATVGSSLIKMPEVHVVTERNVRAARSAGGRIQAVEAAVGSADAAVLTDSMKTRMVRRYRFLSWMSSVPVTSAAAAIPFYEVFSGGRRGLDGSDLTEDQRQLLRTCVKVWRDVPEDQHWEGVARYVEALQPSVLDQIELMSDVRYFADRPDAAWRAEELIRVLDLLEAAYPGGGFPAVYRAMRDMQVGARGKALPRHVAADACRRALAELRAKLGL